MVVRLQVTIDLVTGQQKDNMQPEGAKEKIREIARSADIHGTGFTHAAPLAETRERLDEAIAAGYIPPGSIPGKRTLERLVDPALRLKTARSVVTAYLSYYTGEVPPDEPGTGIIAPYTRANYYGEIKLRLAEVAAAMEDEFGAISRVSSNYVTLAEKPLAARSGLGFYGKNGIIISPRHGSYVVLGEIVTDLEIEPDRPLETNCGQCAACMKACPTGAIEKPGRVNRGKCIQYLGERRGTVPYPMRETWGNRLYGCSTCQDVCPFNRDIPAAAPQSPCAHVGASVSLEEVIRMGDKDFARKFDGNQIGMRERNVIRRNAIIAAGSSGATGLAGRVEACFNDPDPMIRGHAVWAFARLRGPEAGPSIERVLRSEWDPDVRSEAERTLDSDPGLV